ncbi:hypothetical protein D9M69_510730 [compost metagenome]
MWNIPRCDTRLPDEAGQLMASGRGNGPQRRAPPALAVHPTGCQGRQYPRASSSAVRRLSQLNSMTMTPAFRLVVLATGTKLIDRVSAMPAQVPVGRGTAPARVGL